MEARSREVAPEYGRLTGRKLFFLEEIWVEIYMDHSGQDVVYVSRPLICLWDDGNNTYRLILSGWDNLKVLGDLCTNFLVDIEKF
jgi:hypothetical protein